MRLLSLFIGILFFLPVCFAKAQYYSLQVVIQNQPDKPVVLGTVSGEEFTPLDTLSLEKMVPTA